MKRLIPILLTCALALGLAGCGDFAPDPTQTPDAAADYSFDRTNFPALAGGSAQEPLAEAIAAIMLGETREGVADLLSFGNTQEAWDRLASGEAGLVLAVFDLAAPLNEEDLEIARRCQGRPALAILNKQDLAGQGEAFTAAQQQLVPYFKAIIPLTARDAASLQPLCQAVAQLHRQPGPQRCRAVQRPPAERRQGSPRCPCRSPEQPGGRLWAGCCRGVHQRCAACPCPPDR